MDHTSSFHVVLDERRLPGQFVVTVEEEGCRTLHWPFHARHDAERKAAAELERLKAEFTHQI